MRKADKQAVIREGSVIDPRRSFYEVAGCVNDIGIFQLTR